GGGAVLGPGPGARRTITPENPNSSPTDARTGGVSAPTMIKATNTATIRRQRSRSQKPSRTSTDGGAGSGSAATWSSTAVTRLSPGSSTRRSAPNARSSDSRDEKSGIGHLLPAGRFGQL